MTHRVQVPRFGNWEAETTIPYSVCFERAVGGRASGEMITPGSHNLEKHCNDSSPARGYPHSGKEKPTEELQPNWEVPTFGDWDGLGEDAQYTVYFEKVRKRGSRGHTAHENDPQNRNSADDARPLARKVPVECKSPQPPKGNRSGVTVHDELKQESNSQYQRSPAASLEGHKKIPTDRPAVVPDTVLESWDCSDPSQISSQCRNGALQSASHANSSYHKSSTQVKQTSANTCCFPWGKK